MRVRVWEFHVVPITDLMKTMIIDHNGSSVPDGWTPWSQTFYTKHGLSVQSFPLWPVMPEIRHVFMRCVRFQVVSPDTLSELPHFRFVRTKECPQWLSFKEKLQKIVKFDGDMLSLDKLCARDLLSRESFKDVEDPTRTCSTRNILHEYDIENQIKNCQCDIYCYHFGDCCSDKAYISLNMGMRHNDLFLNNEMLEVFKCTSTQFPDKKSHHDLGYYMISDCPKSYRNHSLRRHCIVNVEADHQTHLHYLPVVINEIVYRNIFCARCFSQDLEKGSFWDLFFPFMKLASAERCQQFIDSVLKEARILLSSFREFCKSLVLPVPKVISSMRGNTRMGRLCLTLDRYTLNEKQSKDNFSVNDDISQCKKSINHAHLPGHKNATGPVFYAKTNIMFTVVTNFEQICKKCDSMLLTLLSHSLANLEPYFYSTPWNMKPGQFSIFFDSPILLDCKFYEDCEKPGNLIPATAHIILSLTGCSVSVILLSILLYAMVSHQTLFSSEPKRLQGVFIFTKILFFTIFILSYALRNVACKPISILLHMTLLMTFSFSGFIGIKISFLMWKLKNQLASMAAENGNKKMTVTEFCRYLGVIFFCFLYVVAFAVYERVKDVQIFGTTENQWCAVTHKKSAIYLVTVPTSLILLTNIFSTFYSGLTLYWITKSNSLVKTNTVSRLLHFLGKLMCFQGVQWAFGLIYFVTQNEIIQLFFVVLGSFEGAGIFFFHIRLKPFEGFKV